MTRIAIALAAILFAGAGPARAQDDTATGVRQAAPAKKLAPQLKNTRARPGSRAETTGSASPSEKKLEMNAPSPETDLSVAPPSFAAPAR